MDIEQIKSEINEMMPWEILSFIEDILKDYDYSKEYEEATDKYGNPTRSSLLAIINLLARR